MNAKLVDLGDVAVRTKSSSTGPQFEQGKNTCVDNNRRTVAGAPINCPN